MQPNKIIVLGRGLEEIKSGETVIGHIPKRQTERRAEAAGRHFLRNRKRFDEHDARIVCSGGYPGSSEGMAKPEEASEGQFIAKILMDNFDVPSNKIEIEPDSDSTFGNVRETLKADYFDNAEFSEKDPLGLVASKVHGARARRIAKRAFGISDQAGVQIIGGAQELAPFTLYDETIAYFSTGHFLRGVGAGDIDGLVRADEGLTEFGGHNRLMQLAIMANWARQTLNPPKRAA